MKTIRHPLLIVICVLAIAIAGVAQNTSNSQNSLPDAPQVPSAGTAQVPEPTAPAQTPPHTNAPRRVRSPNHIFWVIPNYRSEENTADIKPLTPHQKWKIAFDDSFDPSAFLVAGIFAGMSLGQGQYHGFGDGAAAAGKYYAAAFADQAIGNTMTEAAFPMLLHQDPRYFTKGNKYGFWNRTGYAISREVITRGDDGASHFNTSELAGNAVAAGISNLYYPAENRTFGNTAQKWGQQIALDAVFNVMKEFWPDVRDRMFHTR